MKLLTEYLSTKVKPSKIKAPDNQSLRKIVSEEIRRLGDNADLNHIDVSEITDLDDLFIPHSSFNGDISKWNVSKCKTFNSVFYNCTEFNGDISDWDVHNGEEFVGMFEKCSRFNCNINDWNM